jgi:protocatechuate 3,4-dioxygenase beta subunit
MKKFKEWLALLLCSSLLAACGGGGGNPGAVGGGGSGGSGGGTITPPTPTPTVTVTLLGSGGTASNALSSATPLTARATVKDKDGKAVANALVAFTSDNKLVAFTPSAGTTLTDANGVANVTLRPASLDISGAGTVTASVTVAGTAVTGTANYSVGATAITLSTMSLSPNHIGAYGSTVISLDVLAGSAKYTAQQLTVAFSSNCADAGKATLAKTATTSNGTVRVVYRDQGCGNPDTISATVNSGNNAVVSTGSLAIDSPKAASLQFVSAAPTDKSIVIKGNGGLGRTETATLTFKVVDIFGQPLAAQQVDFSKANGADITINKLSDSTDSNGVVITTVNSGLTPNSFRIQATLHSDPTVATISDSVVVTTGLPVQQAFSLSVVSPNVEGWNFDSGTVTPATVVNINVADQAGNPVSDGLPVVFQTNLAAVGSSSKGGCNTVNGGCSVDFRTQAPRTAAPNLPVTPCNTGSASGVSNDSTRTGLATVCASTTDGLNTIFSKIGIFLSGNSADNVYWADNPAGASKLTSTPTDLGSVGATDSKVILLQINDVNFNPMPSDSTVEITNIANATALGVSPRTVPVVFAHTATGDASSGTGITNASIPQGSYHTVTVGSTVVPPAVCTTALNATFNVTVTTPRGQPTSYPFKLRFTCP